jgi:hypothetical protein
MRFFVTYVNTPHSSSRHGLPGPRLTWMSPESAAFGYPSEKKTSENLVGQLRRILWRDRNLDNFQIDLFPYTRWWLLNSASVPENL